MTHYSNTPDDVVRRRTIGKHRRPARAGIAVTVAAAAVAAGLVLTPTASADPVQPGTGGAVQPGTGGGAVQPGTGLRPAPAPTPAPAPEPAPVPEPEPAQARPYLGAYTPSPTVQQYGYRSYGDTDYTDYTVDDAAYTPPATVVTAPPALVPAPIAPPPPPTVKRTVIRPVDAPEGTILVGANPIPRPDFVDPVVAEQFNNTTQALQADGANALLDAGFVDAPRADRIAAGTAAGVITGGLTGAAVAGIPATAIGAVGGGLLGLGIGSATLPFTYWVPGIGWVLGPGVGAAIGAGAGAAGLGIPAALVGAGIGGAIGGAIGATVAGGENVEIEEPAPAAPVAPAPVAPAPVAPAPAAPAPAPAPVIPADEVTRVVADTTTAITNAGGGSFVDTARTVIDDATAAAPSVAAAVRDTAAVVPGGSEALTAATDAVDTAITENPQLQQQVTDLVGAALAGLPA